MMRFPIGFLIALSLAVLAAPPAWAQQSSVNPANYSGFGCVVNEAGAAKVYCSARQDCKDLFTDIYLARLDRTYRKYTCEFSVCKLVPGCTNPNSDPGNDPSSGPVKPSSTFTPPPLPIRPGLPIPNAVDVSGPEGQGPAALVANFYLFAFVIAGFLAFAMLIYAGVRYTFAAGSHTAKEDAKDAMRQVGYGLGLLLVAYLILSTINPDLTRLQLPTLVKYNPPTPPPRSDETIAGVNDYSVECQQNKGTKGCTCQDNRAKYARSITKSCQPSLAVGDVVGCVFNKIEVVPTSIAGDRHHINSCHFGGKTCADGAAMDYGINRSQPKTLPEVLAAVQSCAGSHKVQCFYETADGDRVKWGVPGITHLHCNVNNQTCGCDAIIST